MSAITPAAVDHVVTSGSSLLADMDDVVGALIRNHVDGAPIARSFFDKLDDVSHFISQGSATYGDVATNTTRTSMDRAGSSIKSLLALGNEASQGTRLTSHDVTMGMIDASWTRNGIGATHATNAAVEAFGGVAAVRAAGGQHVMPAALASVDSSARLADAVAHMEGASAAVTKAADVNEALLRPSNASATFEKELLTARWHATAAEDATRGLPALQERQYTVSRTTKEALRGATEPRGTTSLIDRPFKHAKLLDQKGTSLRRQGIQGIEHRIDTRLAKLRDAAAGDVEALGVNPFVGGRSPVISLERSVARTNTAIARFGHPSTRSAEQDLAFVRDAGSRLRSQWDLAAAEYQGTTFPRGTKDTMAVLRTTGIEIERLLDEIGATAQTPPKARALLDDIMSKTFDVTMWRRDSMPDARRIYMDADLRAQVHELATILEGARGTVATTRPPLPAGEKAASALVADIVNARGNTAPATEAAFRAEAGKWADVLETLHAAGSKGVTESADRGTEARVLHQYEQRALATLHEASFMQQLPDAQRTALTSVRGELGNFRRSTDHAWTIDKLRQIAAG